MIPEIHRKMERGLPVDGNDNVQIAERPHGVWVWWMVEWRARAHVIHYIMNVISVTSNPRHRWWLERPQSLVADVCTAQRKAFMF